MILYLVLVSIVLGIWILHYHLRNNEEAKKLDKIPGPPGLPVFGSIHIFLVAQDKLFQLNRRMTEEFGDLYKVWMGPFQVINICGPDDVETVLSNSKYNEKSPLYDYLRPWLGDGLLLSYGKKWHSRRKILTPAFHFNVLRHFSKVLEENSWKLVDKLQPEVHKQGTDILTFITTFTLHSICETSMGTYLEDESSRSIRSYKDAVYEIGELLTHRATRPWLSSPWAFNSTLKGIRQKTVLSHLHGFTNKVIDERRQYREKNGNPVFLESDNDDGIGNKKRMAMLDVLLNAEKDGLIDRDGIREEVDTFMFEGHDTTASGICFTLMLLANHQEAQERAYQECLSVFGESTQRQAPMSQLNELKYLECCIKEALRLYPSVPFISRRLASDVQFKNYLVPTNTWCHIHIYDLHRRPDLWPEPEAFKPERFDVDKGTLRHPYAYIPFSAGPRNCIGQRFAMLELKSSIAAIIRSYKLLPVTKPEDIVFMTDLVLRAKTPIYVRFQNRG